MSKVLNLCHFQITKMEKQHTTLGEFIISKQNDFKKTSGELTRLMSSIRLAAKVVNHEIRKAALVDITGAAGEVNVQGEAQQKLDVLANDLFKQTLINREIVCGIASEEEDDFVVVSGTDNSHKNKYVLLMDPLDGSSNIDVNVSVGTIFSIYKRISPIGTPVTKEDFLQKGRKQVAAGYVAYGTSTILVFTTGSGVNGFTLNQAIGTFYLSHPNIQIPKTATIYSVSEGYFTHFQEGMKRFLVHCKELVPEDKRPYTARYVGSLVSDFHRNMIKGGVYIYPATAITPNGKLRLLYECNPMAFICEQAGGKASDGFTNILDIEPTELHQRVPFYCGSTELVEKAESFMHKYSADEKPKYK